MNTEQSINKGSLQLSKNKEKFFVFAIILSVIFQPINSTMMSVALPSLTSYFHISTLTASWTVTVYLIINAAILPIGGKLGDVYGYKKILLIGILFFLIGSFLCVFAMNFPSLIIFRCIQSIGASMLLPNAIATLRYIVKPIRLNKTLSIATMLVTLGTAVGPLIGSLVISTWSWESIFWINIPFLLIGLISVSFLPKITPVKKEKSFDIFGSFYLACALTLTVVISMNYSAKFTIILIGLLMMSIIMFIKQEKRVKNPIIDFALFKNSTFTKANISGFMIGLMMYSILLITPIYLNELGFSLRDIGYTIIAFSLAFSLCNGIAGFLADKLGYKKTVLLSFGLCFLSSLSYLVLYVNYIYSLHIIVLTVIGFGIGIGMTVLQLIVLRSVEKENSGISTGMFSSFRYMGQIVATVLVGYLTSSYVLIILLILISFVGIILSKESSLILKYKTQKTFGENYYNEKRKKHGS